MRIFIATEGGSKRGSGHITRCESLLEAFRGLGHRPEMVVDLGGDDGRFLERKGYRVFDWLEDEGRLAGMIRGGDILVIDSYHAGSGALRRLSGAVRLAAFVDDFKRLDYPPGVVINGGINAGRMNYPAREGVTYLLGCGYAPLRSEFADVPEREIRRELSSLLVTFGGEDPRGLTPAVTGFLKTAFPALKKKVVIGNGFSDKKALEELAGGDTELLYGPSAGEMKEAMLSCDAALSAGGQTLYEAARVGLPTVAVAVAENQLDNIEGWKEAGFIRYAGWWEDKGLLDGIAACLDSIRGRDERLGMSEAGRSAVDGRGAARAASALISLLEGAKT